jgi:Proteasome assembly chaperone 4
MAEILANGTLTATKPLELSFPLPYSASTKIYLHLTKLQQANILFLTAASPESASSAVSLGSFVYAIPNHRDRSQLPLSTPLYTQTDTIDFARRLATVLAKKTGKPTYVGNSISFASAGGGGNVNEEMDGVRRCVDVVVAAVEGRLEAADQNGV